MALIESSILFRRIVEFRVAILGYAASIGAAAVFGNEGTALSINCVMPVPVSLVVDDEPFIRKYVSTILNRQHFRTLEAEDGADALRIVEDLGGEVDLIVSDIQMPKRDGISFAKAVKDAYPAVPIILISGQAKPDAAFEFVEKPFSPAALVKAVRNALASKASKNPK